MLHRYWPLVGDPRKLQYNRRLLFKPGHKQIQNLLTLLTIAYGRVMNIIPKLSLVLPLKSLVRTTGCIEFVSPLIVLFKL